MSQFPDGQWSSGLFDCFNDPSTCIFTCFCPCVAFGRIVDVVDRGTSSGTFAALLEFALSTVACAYLYTFNYRSKLRGLYSLESNPAPDFLVHCFCMRCALCQEYRELKFRGVDPSIGWIANVEKGNRGATVPPNAAQGMNR